jgi:uncharacterized delta-60 repeat protein
MISTKKVSVIAQVILLFVFSAFTTLAAGEVDPTFSASTHFYDYASGERVYAIAGQPDGKVIVGGVFTVVNGYARHGIVRLNTDGTTDTSFNPPDLEDSLVGTLGGLVNDIVLQPDGKILVGGRFNVTGTNYYSLIRLNTDGSLDTSFSDLASQSLVRRIILLPDSSILAVTNSGVSKVNSNGTPFQGFIYQNSGGPVQEAALQPDQKFLVSDQAIERRNPDGTRDNSFPSVVTNGVVTDMKVVADGKILVAGTFSSVNGFTSGHIARLNNDGSVDLTFNNNMTGANFNITDLVVAPDGKIFIAGPFSTYNGVSRPAIAKLNSDGTLDNSFSYTPAPTTTTWVIELMSNGQIVLGREVFAPNNSTDPIARINADGSPDPTFKAEIGRQSRVREVAQATDGKIYIGGEFPLVNGVARNSLARLNSDGSLDTGFVPYFNNLITNQIIYAVAPQSDGKVVVGTHQGIVLRRLNSDGSQDTSFTMNLTNGSIVHDVTILPDGKILIAGNFAFFADPFNTRMVARLNSDGTNDVTFNVVPVNNTVYRAMPQPDGKVVIGGEFTAIGPIVRGRVARLNANGTIDNSFNPPGGANNSVYSLDLQADGKVVIGGVFTALNGSSNQVRIGRLNADGSLDAGFVQTVNANVSAVKVQPDGRILIGGGFTQVAGDARRRIARLNAGGALDSTFNPGATASVSDIKLQTDNKILLGGDFTKVNNVSNVVTVARLLNPPAVARTIFDYDGDGRADVSVFRPSTNRWYIFKSSDSTVSETTFGTTNDIAAPADYDGDGKTDIGIFRASSGDWWYLSSIDSVQKSVHWGASGDVPRPSDFDGDGKTDFVVFRPSNNTWYRFGSTGAVSITPFGLTGDKPVTGDFDGDGKSDVAIYRPSSGDWWWQSSVDNVQRATHWGISTDIPAPADYDGDGKTDFAVYRPSNGTWYIYNSGSLTSTILNFGIAEDKPVPADYDGDGKADIAVFRPSTGVWYLMKTTQGFTAQQFGISTDIPTENAFIP